MHALPAFLNIRLGLALEESEARTFGEIGCAANGDIAFGLGAAIGSGLGAFIYGMLPSQIGTPAHSGARAQHTIRPAGGPQNGEIEKLQRELARTRGLIGIARADGDLKYAGRLEGDASRIESELRRLVGPSSGLPRSKEIDALQRKLSRTQGLIGMAKADGDHRYAGRLEGDAAILESGLRRLGA